MKNDEHETEILESSIDSNTTITDLSNATITDLSNTTITDLSDDLSNLVPQLEVPERLLITTILEDTNLNSGGKVLEIDSGTFSKSFDNISAWTLASLDQKSSHHPIQVSTDTKSSSPLNNDREDASSFFFDSQLLSSHASQLLLMQLLLQWKENKNHIDELMKKSLELSKIIEESIEPNEVIVKMREKEKENQMLQLLVRQYESTLDIVMKKFRTQTSLIHDRKLREQTELEAALENERNENEKLITENTLLQTKLEECTKAMREALSSLDHTPTDDLNTQFSNILSIDSTGMTGKRRKSE